MGVITEWAMVLIQLQTKKTNENENYQSNFSGNYEYTHIIMFLYGDTIKVSEGLSFI